MQSQIVVSLIATKLSLIFLLHEIVFGWFIEYRWSSTDISVENVTDYTCV